ncbi:hypothetical protein [Streptomyces sp. T028]
MSGLAATFISRVAAAGVTGAATFTVVLATVEDWWMRTPSWKICRPLPLP